ncbi:hypothetical protein KI387_022425 [Taxus chinensis]|uniref:Early-responsive to dehydration stress protein n=1 Tax=Taxus chinensis TaxID=29808 RepID=A0AA38G1W3_TAXCH|nr:hypothetical protein KI387_022425 [Taxus chinensis]
MLVSAFLTSVGINVGLCILLLSLYSILKKQPGNVNVYAPRIAAEERAKERGSLERFVPSAGWILRAWRASEDEFLEVAGFDAYVFLRIYVFSLRIFSFAAAIGVFVLLPINYFGKDFSDIPNQSLDSFTIANVQSGSKRLWVHFCAVYLISGAACCLLYLEYRGIAAKRLAYFYSSPPQPNHFTILVRGIPKFDQYSMSDTVEEFFTQYHPSTYLSHQMVYHTGKVEALMHEAEMLYKKVLQLKEKPRFQRQHQREGFLGLFGSKVDPVDHYTKKLENVEENVRSGQLDFLQKKKEVPAAFVSFKSRYGATVASKIPQSTNPLLWVTKLAPEPQDVYRPFLSAPYLQRWISRFVVMVAVFFLTILFLVPVLFVQGLAQLDQLEKFLPFLKKILTTKVISQVITGYLPSLILLLFMKTVPPIMMLFSAMQGSVSNSGKQKSACIKVLYFTIWNVFFATVLSGSAFSQLDNFISNPKDIPRKLAVVVPGQATFFITYVLTSGWTGLSVEITRLFPLIVDFFRRHFSNSIEDDDCAPTFPYHQDLPKVLLFGLLGFTYSLLAPLILPFLLIYFSVGFIMYRNQMLNIYLPRFETSGQYWPIVHNCTIFSLIFMQIITIGIFGLKKLPLASGLVIPVTIITLLFNNYCGKRFLAMFDNYPAERILPVLQTRERYGRLAMIEAQFDDDDRAILDNLLYVTGLTYVVDMPQITLDHDLLTAVAE